MESAASDCQSLSGWPSNFTEKVSFDFPTSQSTTLGTIHTIIPMLIKKKITMLFHYFPKTCAKSVFRYGLQQYFKSVTEIYKKLGNYQVRKLENTKSVSLKIPRFKSSVTRIAKKVAIYQSDFGLKIVERYIELIKLIKLNWLTELRWRAREKASTSIFKNCLGSNFISITTVHYILQAFL